MMAYRSSLHETTGFTPNALMLGREVCTPLDVMFEMPSQLKRVTHNQWCWLLQERLENAHRHVRVNTEQGMARQKHYHDRKLHWETYSPGDRVCVYFPRVQQGKSPKFTTFWNGPFTVKKKMSDVTYLVDCGRRGSDQVIQVDRMRPLRSQILTGEGLNDSTVELSTAEIAEPDIQTPNDNVMTDDGETDKDDGLPPARQFRSRRPPTWLKDYETDF